MAIFFGPQPQMERPDLFCGRPVFQSLKKWVAEVFSLLIFYSLGVFLVFLPYFMEDIRLFLL
jgi:hypothetical protein